MYPELKTLFMLDSSITYLNHGSFGACPKPIFDDLIKWQKQLENEPVRHLAYDIYPLLEKSRKSLSKYIGCDKDDLIFTPNPSTALNTVIKSLDLNKGDEILTTNHEYGALDKTWSFICKKTGAKYIKQKINLPLISNENFINQLISGITDKTKIIFLSHITSSTALIFPAEEICKIAKKKNIMCIIDGAHVPGHMKLDISTIDPDVYVGACHKWMCSPKGVSFLYVKNSLQNMIDPLVVSWGYEAEEPGHSQFLDYHQWQGTRDMSAYLTISKTIEFLNKNKWDEVASECREINLWARKEINQLLSQKPLCSEKFLGQMSSIYLNFKNPIQTQIDFYIKYNIQIPFIMWNNISLIRISIQAYNEKEDVYKLLDALKKEFC
jgi:isopenicillin-N epimerase